MNLYENCLILRQSLLNMFMVFNLFVSVAFFFPETENFSAVSGESFVGAQSQPYSSAGDSGISFANTQTGYPTGTSVRIALLNHY